jgi:hypothetical protein
VLVIGRKGNPMTEFERKGHWRTLSDGTRTWVSPHLVDRESERSKPLYSPEVLDRRGQEVLNRAAEEKARKKRQKALKKQRKSAKAGRKRPNSQTS